MLVQVLDRILDGEDVSGRGAVAVVDHRRQRGGLARTGRAHHQHQPTRGHDDVLQHLRQVQLLDARDMALDRTDHHAHLTALLEHVDAEAPGVGQGDGHVELKVALELRYLALVHQRVSDFLDHSRWQAGAPQRIQLALDLDVDRRSGGQKHVRSVLFGHQLQEVADIHTQYFPNRWRLVIASTP
ncbi:hypothetical protein D3C71_1509890 [compost metagenome]